LLPREKDYTFRVGPTGSFTGPVGVEKRGEGDFSKGKSTRESHEKRVSVGQKKKGSLTKTNEEKKRKERYHMGRGRRGTYGIRLKFLWRRKKGRVARNWKKGRILKDNEGRVCRKKGNLRK